MILRNHKPAAGLTRPVSGLCTILISIAVGRQHIFSCKPVYIAGLVSRLPALQHRFPMYSYLFISRFLAFSRSPADSPVTPHFSLDHRYICAFKSHTYVYVPVRTSYSVAGNLKLQPHVSCRFFILMCATEHTKH